MALQITVTKKLVSGSDKLWYIALNLVAIDNSTVVLDRDFMVKYRTGQDPEERVKAVRDDMQSVIDAYKSQQQILGATQLDSAVVWLNGNLVG